MSEPAQTPEAVVVRVRPHGRAMFWPSLALIAVAGATGYFYGWFDEQWQNLAVLGAAALAVLLLWLLPLLGWLGRNYTITTRRVILRSGFFVRVRQELLHSRGYDVTVRKTALQSMFRSGDVQINAGLDHPIVLRDVSSADLVLAVLHDLMETSQNSVSVQRQQTEAHASDETTAWGVR
ncbi:PH domain-containing protein [Glaciihabitans sp. dw_435]|uniref:PH domain-containing protein n=1 Tax=Glaciihabitans sp. dw_435 TaxID=2720081 RepID=UPI001C4A638E|nr:PH domain-containing protein [Glaciihabitans sp. dw_435]